MSSLSREWESTPRWRQPRFDCPNCGTFAAQSWFTIQLHRGTAGFGELPNWAVARCESCGRYSIWRVTPRAPSQMPHFSTNGQLVYPSISTAPPPSADMPEDVVAIYEEARQVSQISPKSAAALLRLALQHLVDDLLPGSGNINAKIGRLVQQGLRTEVQRAMDIVRVVGNKAVHPGEINLDDDLSVVPVLFSLVGVIVEQMITQPRIIAKMYQALPIGQLDAIEARDKPND